MTTTKLTTDNLIMSDEGTHSHPRTTRVYMTPAGKYRTVVKFGNGLISDETTDACPKHADITTEGTIRHFTK